MRDHCEAASVREGQFDLGDTGRDFSDGAGTEVFPETAPVDTEGLVVAERDVGLEPVLCHCLIRGIEILVDLVVAGPLEVTQFAPLPAVLVLA